MSIRKAIKADTLLNEKYLESDDDVIEMYHDQGLTVLKSQGIGSAVKNKIGLNFIRTSVDHGTAFDLAGSGQAIPKMLDPR